MTHEEKLKAFEQYKSKQAMIGKSHMVDESFSIIQNKITIDIVSYAEGQGTSADLKIPDFVEKIR